DRQTGDGCIALELDGTVDEVRWIAPLILGLDPQSEWLPGPHEGGKHSAPAHARAGHDCNLRAFRQGHVIVRCDRIDKHAELEFAFAKGLHPDAGRAEAAVAEAHRNGVLRVEEILDYTDVKRAAPGADVALELPLGLQRRTI